ncbi:MAG TPA: tryptophan 2,3-dioxygenase [Virgibacillus sp.]|nr:tryptophan 2,3-dioxygenase [Virgibacillus sp.]
MTDTPKAFQSEKDIQTDFLEKMTYSDYLQLETLLGSQKQLTDHHDEMLFIVIHHVSELWLKLIIHETTGAIEAIKQNDLQTSFKMLTRVSRIQIQLIQAWDVLATLTPSEYMEFRDKLGQASGFQSYQYRLVEFALGYKTPYILKIYENDSEIHSILKQAYHSPGLYDVAIQLLARKGFFIPEEILSRDVSKTYQRNQSVQDAWLQVYKDVSTHWELYELAEKLVDIEDRFQQWRFHHMKTVERIIGHKKGTGGSSGVGYLKKVLDHTFFPELWHLRTEI